MFRRKLRIGDKVLIKRNGCISVVDDILYNPYTPWKSISSYKVGSKSDYSFYGRNDLKKL
jgi:hypothetical protein